MQAAWSPARLLVGTTRQLCRTSPACSHMAVPMLSTGAQQTTDSELIPVRRTHQRQLAVVAAASNATDAAQHAQQRRSAAPRRAPQPWEKRLDEAQSLLVKDVQILPHRRRAAARKADNAAAERRQDSRPNSAALPGQHTAGPAPQAADSTSAAAPYPTFIPRNPGVVDGPWLPVDSSLVKAAIADAEVAVTAQRVNAEGFVLLGKTLEEVEALVTELGHPRYRAKQLLEGVLQGAHTIEDISNIPKQMKAQLIAAGVRTGRSKLHKSVTAPDGTAKFLLQLSDGRVVETVGIPNDEEPTTLQQQDGPAATSSKRGRLTVCVSSQVGCPMKCTFCATGKGGFARNLMPHEVLDQVMTVREAFGRRVSNVVFMGMGEPLLNLPAVVKSYKLLNEQLGVGGRSITISTVGVPNAIPRLARTDIKSTLAVSIHAPNQQLREALIPSAKVYPIEALVQDCTKYFKITGRRVTFEYTLLAGVNDGAEHAQEVAALLRAHDLMSHVNVIPYNPVDDSVYKRPSRNRVFAFVNALEAAGLTTTIRITRGLEAAAACGQLRNMHQKEPLPEYAVAA